MREGLIASRKPSLEAAAPDRRGTQRRQWLWLTDRKMIQRAGVAVVCDDLPSAHWRGYVRGCDHVRVGNSSPLRRSSSAARAGSGWWRWRQPRALCEGETAGNQNCRDAQSAENESPENESPEN